MSPLKVWLLAARPPTLTAAVVPVLVGTAAAARDGHIHLLPFLGALAAAVLIQVGTNFANDVFDYEHGADTSARLGPVRVTQSGLASPTAVRRAMLLAFGGAAAIGLYLTVVGGWPILVVGVLSIAAGVAYTGGPWPLGYHGLGDLFVFLFFGLVATAGSYYLQASALTAAALGAAAVVGCTVTAILVVNNLRDLETDRRSGKRTLAVRLGDRRTRLQYAALLLAPYALTAALAAGGVLPWTALVAWFSLPVALVLVRAVLRGAAGPALNGVLKGTARLHLLLGLLLSGGLVL
ncbi:MAG TPA: 1,4-dihydroxy-2-naphthoate polyprenyltransferase [Dehalococcoidia bacterium]